MENAITPFSFVYETLFHDMKGALSNMYVYLQLMEKGGLHQETADRYIQSLKLSWFQVMKIINDANDSERMMSGALQACLQRCDVARLAAEIVESAKMLSRRKCIDITFCCNVASQTFVTDKILFERILLNLLSNAIKCTEDDCVVHVKMVCEPHRITVCVTGGNFNIDNGMAYHSPAGHGSAENTAIVPRGLLWVFVVTRLVDLLKGRFHIQSGVNGNKISVIFPTHLEESASAETDTFDTFYDRNITQVELSVT